MKMKLTELNPRWVGYGGESVSDANGNPIPRREGIGIILDCPCGKCGEYGQLAVFFKNPLDGKSSPITDNRALWDRTGDAFETLTLKPSILRSTNRGGCGWHGFITNGDVTTC